jgi:hypothetical protein
VTRTHAGGLASSGTGRRMAATVTAPRLYPARAGPARIHRHRFRPWATRFDWVALADALKGYADWRCTRDSNFMAAGSFCGVPVLFPSVLVLTDLSSASSGGRDFPDCDALFLSALDAAGTILADLRGSNGDHRSN